MCLSALTSVRMLTAEKLSRMHVPDERKAFDRMLGRIAGQLPKLSDVISSKYLIHAGLTQQLTEFRKDQRAVESKTGLIYPASRDHLQ